jgi:3-hydroxybutyryl-CoA dehydrogenase
MMKLEDIKNVAVLGAGIMGHGIAQSFLMGGYQVMLYDVDESILETAKAHIRNNLELFCRYDLIKEEEIVLCLERVTTTTDLKQAVKDANFIIEAAPEDLGLKQELFERVESYCPQGAIMASNTSSLTMANISERVKNKGRLVTTHWFNPPYIVPTVEVVKSKWTRDDIMDVTYALLEKIKKLPVRINMEIPGFLVNRIQMAMYREIVDLHEKGVASAADIDRAVKGSLGFRLASIGPMLTMDLNGIQLFARAYENMAPLLNSTIEVPKSIQDMVTEGHVGIKSGRGYYDYDVDFSEGTFDEVIKRRDRDFLQRLKNHY